MEIMFPSIKPIPLKYFWEIYHKNFSIEKKFNTNKEKITYDS